MIKKLLTVNDIQKELRLDSYIPSQLSELSRNAAVKLIEDGSVTINGKSAKKNAHIHQGDIIELIIPDIKQTELVPEFIPLDIVFEDEFLLVVNKPKGMVVHPAVGNHYGTLVNALLAHCGESLSGINGVARPGIVHRLDKDTSGLLIVAKTDEAHRGLAKQIETHSFGREYESLVYGRLKEKSGSINLPVGRNKNDRKKMTVDPENGRRAVTYYTVLEEYPVFGSSYIRLRLETGRTHQIRVHMSYLGHPVIGDEVYGNKASRALFPEIRGQCLHAKFISFIHPITGQEMSFDAPLPDYFMELLKKCRKSIQ